MRQRRQVRRLPISRPRRAMVNDINQQRNILVEAPGPLLAARECLLTLEAELDKVTARRDGRLRVAR